MAGSPPFTREGLSDSYISSADLASLSLSSSSTTCAEPARHKHVAFCPLALLISCGDGSEKDAKGRARIAVRTYSMDTPSLTSAWSKVVSGLSSSLQPLLSPTSSNSVVSVSGTSPTSSYRHLPDPTNQDDDEDFLPRHSRLSFRLPSLTRVPPPRSSSRSSSTPCHSILKSPERTTIPLPSPPSLSTSALSTSPTSLPLPSPPLHPHALIESVPLSPCCLSCAEAADLGHGAGYEERWSRGARRKRRQDRQREKDAGTWAGAGGPQWSGSAGGWSGSAQGEKVGEVREGEDVRVPGMMGVRKVDELAASGVEKGRERREKKEEVGCDHKNCEHELLLEEFEGVSLKLAELPARTDDQDPQPVPLVDPILATTSPTEPPALPSPNPLATPPEIYVPPPPLPPTTTPVPAAKTKRRFSLSRFGNGIVEAGIAAGMAPGGGRGFSQ